MQNEKIEDVIEILKKTTLDPNSVTKAEKKQLKRLIKHNSALMVEAAQILGESLSENDTLPNNNTRSDEE